MSLASHKCAGCGLFFTPTGLNSHIRQTRNDQCRSWHWEHLPQINEHDNQDLDRYLDLENDQPPQDFEGDLYSNDYREQDFPGFDDAPHPVDSSDDEDVAVGDEDGWEPSHSINPLVTETFYRLSIPFHQIPFHQIGKRAITDSAKNLSFGSSMIAQIVTQVLH